MTPFFADPRAVLIRGESLDVLRAMPDASIDSMITDPPAGIGFMGKSWDADKGGRAKWIAWLAEIMAEARRVLKSGGHGLVWALPKTSHWTGFALEDAGFEVRDRISHLFGTGFPKGLNVSKEIDRLLGKERKVLGEGAASCEFIRRGEACQGHGDAGKSQSGATVHAPATAPGSPEAARWEGWDIALKPGMEDWWLVRKPLAGTVAANVLEHGTGALNIDACRIPGEVRSVPQPDFTQVNGRATRLDAHARNGEMSSAPGGRWPANVILDEAAAAELDATVGERPSGARKGQTFGDQAGDGGRELAASKGGPSRYFYVAKPARKERDAGCEALPARTAGEATDREEGSEGLNSPRAGAGRTGGARNVHPTVKPVELMRYLCRLITPPGGVVLDPFAGSGSTGVAALHEGFSFIGIDRDLDDETGEPLGYCEIARARIIHTLKEIEE